MLKTQKHKIIKMLENLKKGGGQSQGAGRNPKQQGKQDINGVPKAYLNEKNICIRFNNRGGCPQNATHKHRYDESKTLQHICGCCFAKDGAKDAHVVLDCKKHDFSALFQWW